MPPSADRRTALWVLVLLSLIWGYNWIVMKFGLRYAGPFDFAAARTGAAVLSLFIAMLLLGRSLRPPPLGWTLLLGLTQTGIYTGLISWALVEGGAGKTSVLVFTMPFWTLLMARLLLGERLRGAQWLAVGLAALGLLLVLEPWRMQGGALSKLLALGGGITWAASAIVAKQLRARHEVDLLSLTSWQMLLGLLPLLAVIAWVPERPLDLGWELGLAVIFSGVIGTAGGWFMWLYVLHRLPAGTAGLNSLAIPVIAVLAAWLHFGEQPRPAELAGMAAIAVALALMAAVAGRRG